MKTLEAVLDTNVLIAALRSRRGASFRLELAVASNAGYIVTHNLRDFAGVASFGIEAITPGKMLLKLQEKK